jgi:hypothetical protein
MLGFSAFAQTFDLDKNRVPLTSLDGLWRFHPGDDMHWADPSFDDSSWALLRTDKPWTEQGFPELEGFVWYRFRVALSAGERPTALMLPYVKDDYEVFVNGRKVRSGLGGRLPRLVWQPMAEAVPLDTTSSAPSKSEVVALRIWLQVGRNRAIYPPSLRHPVGIVGRTNLIEQRIQQAHASALAVTEGETADVIISGLIGALVLGLYCLRNQDKEYLWFALILLAVAASTWIVIVGYFFGQVTVLWADTLSDVFWDLHYAAALLFFRSILSQRRSLVWKICFTVTAANAIIRAVRPDLSPAIYSWGQSFHVVLAMPAYCWILVTLIRRTISGDRNAQLLLLPALGSFGWDAVQTTNNALLIQQWIPEDIGNSLGNSGVDLGPWHVMLTPLFDMIFAASLLAFLIRRFALSRQREERLAADVEAARQIQQILLPEENPSVNGFQIESVYLPSEAVSGDFFQHIPDGHNGLLVVAGDVAGKGLQAAMLVSVLVGAIRTEASHTTDPGKILAVLNDRLQGRGTNRFATCVVAHISSTGEMRVANAGHIPPYLNGAPLDLPGSLPLGMAADTEYEVHEFRLASGDALRFVSDGVLEARDAAGNLLGFERTRELSRDKAQQIAKAAQEFGQKDDITVVAVDFLGVAHAAA